MKYACVVGYGYDCPEEHIQAATEISGCLASKGYGGCAGGYIGIFNAVFTRMHQEGKPTLLYTDAVEKEIDTSLISTVRLTADVHKKHDAIVEQAEFIVVIGGGKGSEMLSQKFHKAGKPVFGLKESGGATATLSSDQLFDMKALKEAIPAL